MGIVRIQPIDLLRSVREPFLGSLLQPDVVCDSFFEDFDSACRPFYELFAKDLRPFRDGCLEFLYSAEAQILSETIVSLGRDKDLATEIVVGISELPDLEKWRV